MGEFHLTNLLQAPCMALRIDCCKSSPSLFHSWLSVCLSMDNNNMTLSQEHPPHCPLVSVQKSEKQVFHTHIVSNTCSLPAIPPIRLHTSTSTASTITHTHTILYLPPPLLIPPTPASQRPLPALAALLAHWHHPAGWKRQ